MKLQGKRESGTPYALFSADDDDDNDDGGGGGGGSVGGVGVRGRWRQVEGGVGVEDLSGVVVVVFFIATREGRREGEKKRLHDRCR